METEYRKERKTKLSDSRMHRSDECKTKDCERKCIAVTCELVAQISSCSDLWNGTEDLERKRRRNPILMRAATEEEWVWKRWDLGIGSGDTCLCSLPTCRAARCSRGHKAWRPETVCVTEILTGTPCASREQ
jgi:hypothetical protein